MAKQKPASNKVYDFGTKLQQMIKQVFNSDVFSIYDGIIEKVDLKNGNVSVRIPDLGDSLYEECKFLVPCLTSTSAIYPIFKTNSQVLVGFKQFSLANPIIIGPIINSPVTIPITDNQISLINKNCKITISESAITLTNGTSSITLDSDGIKLVGTSVTANGEDLTVDDTGAI